MEPTAGERTAKRRIALLIEYDGVPFNGWQIQKSGVTIQSELHRSIEVLTGEKVNLVASGRTDAGVHAYNQIAHFDTTSSITLFKMVRSLNGISSDAIAVKNAYNVPDTFHARFSAVEREYTYFLYNHPQKSPFIKNRAWWVPFPFDIDKANNIAAYLRGTHDFASFCKKSSSGNGTIRTITSLNFSRQGDYIVMTVRAESFIHNMVRIIAGTICGMVQNNVPAGSIVDILQAGGRESGGVTAPPYALYLNKVRYEPGLSEYEDAYLKME